MTRRSTVEHLVKTYELSEKNIREGCRLIAASEKALSEVFLIGDTTRGIDFREECHRSRLNYDDPTEGIEYLRKQIWRVLVDKLEVRRMMSIQKAKELSDWLEKQSGKEDITVPSVLGFFRYYIENLETMLEEQVSEVFDILRPRNSSLVTNHKHEDVGSKVILHYWVEETYPGSGKLTTSYRWQPEYVALENVFSALDGKGSIAKHYRTELETSIREASAGETTYFRYRACKNRNLHLEFKRLDLLKKFNAIAGGKRLRKGASDAAA